MNKMTRNIAAAVIVVVLALLFILGCCNAASATTVPEGHVGIVVKWCKAEDTTLPPGFYITAPWTKVVKMDTRWQKYSTQISAFSKDIQQVDIAVSMSYQIKNTGALRLYKEVGTDYADKIMLPRLLDALKSTFAKYSAEELVSSRERISGEVRDLLSEQLMFYDLSVREIAIEDIDFTDAFTDAIEAKQVATQRKLQVETEQDQQTLVAQEEAKRAKIQAEAEAEKKLIEARANAEAVTIAAEAEANANKQIAASLTPELIEKIKYERWNGEVPKVSGGTPIVDVGALE